MRQVQVYKKPNDFKVAQFLCSFLCHEMFICRIEYMEYTLPKNKR